MKPAFISNEQEPEMTRDEIRKRAHTLYGEALAKGAGFGGESVTHFVEQVEALVDDATKGLRDDVIDEIEGRLCPEDVGIDEYVKHLRARIAELEAEVEKSHRAMELRRRGYASARRRISALEAALELHDPNHSLVIEAAERATFGAGTRG